jgi:hypothetical protein
MTESDKSNKIEQTCVKADDETHMTTTTKIKITPSEYCVKPEHDIMSRARATEVCAHKARERKFKKSFDSIRTLCHKN